MMMMDMASLRLATIRFHLQARQNRARRRRLGVLTSMAVPCLRVQ